MPAKVASGHKSIKHDIIEKANNNIIILVAAATFTFVFCAFASRALISQSLYHGRVIEEKEKALDQLNENIENLETLKESFNAFQTDEVNILGGNPTGDGPLDGNNADLVLDALPDGYNYPALSSSMEKILKEGGYQIGSIGGSEDASLVEVGQTAVRDVEPIEIPYIFSVSSTTEGTVRLLQTLERSIRPIYVDNLQIQAAENLLQTKVTFRTFFTQPKTFELGEKVVK